MWLAIQVEFIKFEKVLMTAEYCYLPLFLALGLVLLWLFISILSAVLSIPTRAEREESERATKQANLSSRKQALLLQIRRYNPQSETARELWAQVYRLDEEERRLVAGEPDPDGWTAKDWR